MFGMIFIIVMIVWGILMTVMFCSMAEEDMKELIPVKNIAESNEDYDKWYVDRYIDEFDDKTGKIFMGYNTIAELNNSAIRNAEADVQVVVDTEKIIFRIRDHGRHNAFINYIKNEFNGVAKNEKGDKARFTYDEVDDLRDLFSKSNEVKIILKDKYEGEYRFTINCDKFGYYSITQLNRVK